VIEDQAYETLIKKANEDDSHASGKKEQTKEDRLQK